MAQVILGITSAAVTANATSYVSLMGYGAPNATESVVYQIIPTSGYISLLALRPVATVTTTSTATLMVNGVGTTLSAATDSAALAHNSTVSIFVTAGDKVSIRFVTNAGSTARIWSYSVVFTPTTPGESILIGNSNNTAPTANQFVGIANPVTPGLDSASRFIIPEQGYLKKFYVLVDTDPGAGGSVTFNVFNNGVAGNNTITLSSGQLTGNDITHVDAIGNAGDFASIKVTVTSAPTLSPLHWGIVYVTPTPGNFLILGGSLGVLSTSGARYIPISGFRGVTTNETGTAGITSISNAFTAKTVYSRLVTAPGAGTGYDFCLRSGATDTALLVNISGTAISGFTNSDVVIPIDTLIDFKQIASAGTPGSGGNWKMSLVGYLPDASNSNFFQMF